VDTYRPVITNKLGRAYGFSVDNAHVRVDVVRSIDPNGKRKKKTTTTTTTTTNARRYGFASFSSPSPSRRTKTVS
jgi:hypothetical protein